MMTYPPFKHFQPKEQVKKVVFVANCLLNQYMRAKGVKNYYREGAETPGIVKPLIQLLLKYGVAVEQLPCIEVFYEGLIRPAGGQDRYNNQKFIELCNKFAEQVVYLVEQYIKAGYKVCCIIGVDGSPTCGVNLTSLGKGKWANDKGIFMKILEQKLKEKGYNIPFVGARLRNQQEIVRTLAEIERYLR